MKRIAMLAILILVVMVPTGMWAQETVMHNPSDLSLVRADQILSERGVSDAFSDIFGNLDNDNKLLAAAICLKFENAQTQRFLNAQEEGLIPLDETFTPRQLSSQVIEVADDISNATYGYPNEDLQYDISAADKKLAGVFNRIMLTEGVATITRYYPDDYASARVELPTLQEAIDALDLEAEAADSNALLIVTMPNPHTASYAKVSYDPGAYGGLIIRTVNGGTGIKWFTLSFQFDHQAILKKYGKDYEGAVIDPLVNSSSYCVTADLGANVCLEHVTQANVSATSPSQFRFNNVIFTDVKFQAQNVTAIDIPQLAAGQVIDFEDVRISGVSAGRGLWMYDAGYEGSFYGEGLQISGTFSGAGIQNSNNTYISNSSVSGNSDIGIYVNGGDSILCDNSVVGVDFDNVVIDSNSIEGLSLAYVHDEPTLGDAMPSGASATISNSRIRSNGGTGIKVAVSDTISLLKNNIGRNNVGVLWEESAGDFHQNIITQNAQNIAIGTFAGPIACSQGAGGPVPNLGDETWCGLNAIVDATGLLISNALTATVKAHGNWWGVSADPDPSVYMTGNIELVNNLSMPIKVTAVGEIELSKNVDGLNLDMTDIAWPDAGTAYVSYGTDPAAVSAGTAASSVMVDGDWMHLLADGNTVTFFKRDVITPYFDPSVDTCPEGD